MHVEVTVCLCCLSVLFIFVHIYRINAVVICFVKRCCTLLECIISRCFSLVCCNGVVLPSALHAGLVLEAHDGGDTDVEPDDGDIPARNLRSLAPPVSIRWICLLYLCLCC